MPRLSERETLTKAVEKYLAVAETHLPEDYPLDVRSVTKALEKSPSTIYKYGLNKLINAAQKRQFENAKLSNKALKRQSYIDKIRSLEAELEQERERNKGLVAQIAIMEVNAARLGFDPEKMYKQPPKPDRSVSRAGTGKQSGQKRRRW